MKALSPLKKYRLKVISAPLLKIVECLIQLATPFLVRYMIDVGIANNDMPYVLKFGAILLSLSIVAFLVTMIAQYLAARVSADYAHDLRDVLYDHFLKLGEADLESFGKNKALTIFTNDCNAMQNGVMMFMRLILRPPFLVIGAVVLAFVISTLGGCIVLGASLLSSGVIAFVIVLSPKRYLNVQNDLDAISEKGTDILSGARPIRAFASQEKEARQFEKINESYRKHGVGVSLLNAFINPLTFCFINLGIVLIAYFGGLELGDGALTSGQLASLISYLTMVLGAIIMFSRMIVSFNRARVSKKRIDSFLSIPEKEERNAVPKMEKSDFLIKMDHVTFSYSENGAPALKDIDFFVRPGESVGIIGGTGSGKSTLLSLLMKTFSPQQGTIALGGVPYQACPDSMIHQQITYIGQKSAIFAGTIRSNLLIAKEDASDEELTRALKKSLAYEFVEKYEDGLSHPVEEFGNNLSGGQKQRLLLARAFLKDSSLLLLDDCMSALDYLSEKEARHNLYQAKNVAKIFVSQRVTSLMGCARIYVMEHGRVLDCGTHGELLKRCPIYKDIYEMQVRAK